MRGFVSVVAVAAALLLSTATQAFAAADRFEPDNSAGAAKAIALSADVIATGAQVHTFSSATDQDWVRFTGAAWREYSVKVYSQSTADPNAWVRVQVYRKSGTGWKAVTSETYLGDDVAETFDFVASTKATYALRFRPYRRTSAAAGKSYYVRLSTGAPKPTAGDVYENADDTRAGARPLVDRSGYDATRYNTDDQYRFAITFKQSELHNIYNPSGVVDEDWYSVNVGSDDMHYFVLFTGLYANRSLEMEVYDSSGEKLGATDNDGSCYVRWGWGDLGSGTYYLRVFAKDSGAGFGPYWYRIGLFGP